MADNSGSGGAGARNGGNKLRGVALAIVLLSVALCAYTVWLVGRPLFWRMYADWTEKGTKSTASVVRMAGARDAAPHKLSDAGDDEKEEDSRRLLSLLAPRREWEQQQQQTQQTQQTQQPAQPREQQRQKQPQPQQEQWQPSLLAGTADKTPFTQRALRAVVHL